MGVFPLAVVVILVVVAGLAVVGVGILASALRPQRHRRSAEPSREDDEEEQN